MDDHKRKKWSDMSDGARLGFAERANKLKRKHPEVKYFSITVDKQRVGAHLRADSSLLYNYMLRLMLAKEMAKHDEVLLVPDPRSIKVASGNSQHEYLQIYLWYEMGAATKLHSKPVDSHKELGIQFADMLSGVVQAHFEDGRSRPWQEIEGVLEVQKLFF